MKRIESSLLVYNHTRLVSCAIKNILELICNEPAEFNLRLDHGLNEDVREWLTGPVNVL